MEEKLHPDVASFLIRFVKSQPNTEGVSNYRGVIRHIQTDNEFSFSSWAEVETFIQLVIPLETTKTE